MRTFEQGDIVRVPFPYTDGQMVQHRPALVVSSGSIGIDGFLIWVAMITSLSHRAWPDDVPIPDLSLAGLRAPSRVRVGKLATIETGRARLLGRLDHASMQMVIDFIRKRIEPS